MKLILIFFISTLFHIPFSVAEQNVPQYGKKRADTYFIERHKRTAKNTVNVPNDPHAPSQGQNYAPNNNYGQESAGTHVMAIQLGFFLDDKAYRWGSQRSSEDVGQWTLGVTYLLGEWINSMDLYFRGDLQGFKVDEENANKLSFSGLVTFPDIRSGFPVYFGAGLGMGVFFDQVEDESNLTLDYQILIGARVLDIYNGIGFLIEAGAKNHIFLTSKGQFNGYFLSLGSVFRF